MIMINRATLLTHFFLPTGQFTIQKVVPQPSGESSKVKVKVRVNVHGVFSVSSASLVEVVKSAEGEEPMEMDNPAKEDEVKSSLLTAFLMVLYLVAVAIIINLFFILWWT